MSTASKVTFGASIAFAVGAFAFINYSQQVERAALRQGPIKDAERMRMKELNRKQILNQQDHIEQQALKEKFELVQPLQSKVITADDDK
ncbi:uncharacterized protein KQ657_002170 [Scheffersomyces spartinae]|uniref:Cytochrome c oxidase assembly protein n=1 Tax=Scheffersomyces spartinae TaxID=45513 RepID=A0A9P7VDF0_9ASCO|nr:uncharacterized protein KQ657_002170 [Scheffersomyces spartinae]KAG7195785.1 hypothetical protein KQ657_002170 [Scheffersomyces spartinae]